MDKVNVLTFVSFQSCCFSLIMLKDENKQAIMKNTKQPQTVSKVLGIYKKCLQMIACAKAEITSITHLHIIRLFVK